MAYTEFCCRSGGSNLNAGSRDGSSTEPGTSADLTYAGGSWVSSTNIFTVASGDPVADGVAVGDFMALDTGGSVAAYIARITARTSTTITLSSTAKAGAKPANGTYTARIGGAWEGPSGTSNFPFGLATFASLVNVSGDKNRINLKNDQTLIKTSAMAFTAAGPTVAQGYASSYGDGGIAEITTSTANGLINATASTWSYRDIKFSSTAVSGTDNLVATVGADMEFTRCIFTGARNNGLNATGNSCTITECEFYNCNTAGTPTKGGLYSTNTYACVVSRCIFHDNNASGSIGAYILAGGVVTDCIFDSNNIGLNIGNATYALVQKCDFYNNNSHGLTSGTGSACNFIIEDCNLIKNGGYGINFVSVLGSTGLIRNCAYGSGTQANASGDSLTGVLQEIGAVIYPADVTPWVDPANGDFRVTLAEAVGAGLGDFLQTAASYAGAVGYPDRGACQKQDAGGGGGGGIGPRFGRRGNGPSFGGVA